MDLFHEKKLNVAVFAQKRGETQSSPRPDAELQSYVGDFENSSVGARYRAVSEEVGDKNGQKAANGSEKRGQKFCLPTKINMCIRCKI